MSRDTSTRRGGLGRGLAALIPTGPPEEDTASKGPSLGTAAADVIIGRGPEPTSTESASRDVASENGDQQAPSPTSEGKAKSDKHQKGDKSKHDKKGQSVGASARDVDDAAPTDAFAASYRELRPSEIQPNPHQPRSVFDEDAMAELVHSITEFGLMQPIVVRKLDEPTDDGVTYQLVMGERRWRASKVAGLELIPAIVRETADSDMLRDALLENIHRAQLNPLEEAAAYQQLLEEFEVTHEELARRIGRSRPVISNMIRLLKLPVPVQRRVAAGVLSAGHARALLSLEAGADAQEALAARIVAEGLSVRATEEAVMLANRDGTPATPPVRRKPMQMPGLQDLAERLSDRLDTRVTVSLGKKKGRIVVEFGSVDDLERIMGVIDQG
ncbi:ParB/RepB/Spo0J family partition protein [Gordonia sp. (in: high G+C Gram-positive bacteria)]|uniref:ParB/RepB/Spo0J family partition protein n=1 Tax=Gordonia sp. (in: high G+C Gram-positive bacteria) TaxID=84139 RepID=UPI001DAFA13D|nr:ParB/RepB/Spo0J family partition protein [Gordonia sp. (in: high G+C Gram-positive bacteria)]MCB1293657.1 ParB/RepB/Spo0J family partition protein [Gordonia sp. (in: high G+C Gram-positive bacteria)]HMS74365.1 ParB/RepB/Spo0J family partition protein [Gordonia sp. (in: high G+C Gram-positive bacteria)]HQV16866.1 ParB/RepB/Spo0J family partition protein [Gordonia sp. (in: high G+C Gram-positive bacteria)]